MDLGATTALTARVALAAAFALSAGTKLARPAAFAEGLADFGVPRSGVVARLLPLVEGALAALLVLVRQEPWPAFLAVAVLALFTGAVVANMASGRAAPCPCFGAPGPRARPVSAATVARNGYLIGLAVVGTGSTAGASPAGTAMGSVVVVTATLVALRRFG